MTDVTNRDPLKDLFDYPLLEAIYGRRSRRFGMGMEIPSGHSHSGRAPNPFL